MNNTLPDVRGAGMGTFSTAVWVVYDGIRYDVPFNRDSERNPTEAGAFELTEDPLPGGTSVTFGPRPDGEEIRREC